MYMYSLIDIIVQIGTILIQMYDNVTLYNFRNLQCYHENCTVVIVPTVAFIDAIL